MCIFIKPMSPCSRRFGYNRGDGGDGGLLHRPRTTDAAAAVADDDYDDDDETRGGSGPVFLASSKYRENTSLPLAQ